MTGGERALDAAALRRASDNVGQHFAETMHVIAGSVAEKGGYRLESPIEEMLFVGFLGIHYLEPALVIASSTNRPDPDQHGATFKLHSQRQFGRYRVDFAIEVRRAEDEKSEPHWIIVECDGHAFHERTPWQAARDKARDRYFNTLGYTVLRFTGSEINADPGQCAFEAVDAALQASARLFGK